MRIPGSFMAGSDLHVSALPGLQRRFRARLGARVPASSFAFLGHHDCQFLWFLLEGREDPLVYYYDDARPDSVQETGKTFSQGLVELVRDECRVEVPDDLE
jgi:hypothetical protein